MNETKTYAVNRDTISRTVLRTTPYLGSRSGLGYRRANPLLTTVDATSIALAVSGMSVAESSHTGLTAGQAPAPEPVVGNVVTAFAAHFHVRRGNEVTWADGVHSVSDLAKQGVEWKVLPSGSHLLERDVIFFDVDQPEDVAEGSGRLIGVAAFKNRKLVSPEEQRAGFSAAGEEEDDDQRGARMTAVGAIVDCGSQRTARAQLAATLPHILQLEGLVDSLSANPTSRDSIQEWFNKNRRKGAVLNPIARDWTTDNVLYPHDPFLMLPSVSNALGPLLPSILKSLLAAHFRLLIYAPPGSQSLQAASFAFNLAELVHAACQSPEGARERKEVSCPVSKRSSNANETAHGLEVIGLIGLHDIANLQKAAKDPARARGWIAWSSDRILLEKQDIYDAVLDLTPMMPSRDATLVDSTALPHFLRAERKAASKGKTGWALRKQSWTTREFAVYRGLDERASLDAASYRHKRRSIGRRRSQASLQQQQAETPAGANAARSPPRLVSRNSSKSSRPSTSTMLAFLTYWLSSLRFLPHSWRLSLRESYGYIPLSIRSDGGVRASIMLLPTSDDEYSQSDEDDDDAEASHQHGSSFLIPSPQMRRLSISADDDRVLNERDQISDDPILAAVGAGSFAYRRRNSRSRALSQKSVSAMANDAASVHGGGEDVSRDESVRRASWHDGSNKGETQEQIHIRETRDSARLAHCLFAVWAEWIGELVVDIQDLIQEIAMEVGHTDGFGKDRPSAGGQDEEDTNADADGEVDLDRAEESAAAPLLRQTANDDDGDQVIRITLSAKDLSSVGLSNSSAIDVELVRFLSSTIDANIAVDVQTSWSILSWLCW